MVKIVYISIPFECGACCGERDSGSVRNGIRSMKKKKKKLSHKHIFAENG